LIEKDTTLGEHDLFDHPSERDLGKRISIPICDCPAFLKRKKVVRMIDNSL